MILPGFSLRARTTLNQMENQLSLMRRRRANSQNGRKRIFIGTLAAAYAEVGDFDAAIKYQRQAMDLGSDYPDKPVTEKALKLFQQRKPYRE
jgi:hypothetical protein